MLVTSQLPIQTTYILYSFRDVHLCPPLWKRFRHPCLAYPGSPSSQKREMLSPTLHRLFPPAYEIMTTREPPWPANTWFTAPRDTTSRMHWLWLPSFAQVNWKRTNSCGCAYNGGALPPDRNNKKTWNNKYLFTNVVAALASKRPATSRYNFNRKVVAPG